jgi:type III pantothenate kinase
MAIDVGNTDVSIGIFAPDDTTPRAAWRLETRPHRTKDEYGLLIEAAARHYGFKTADICHIIISCVVPLALHPLVQSCQEYWRIAPLVVGQGIKTGVDMRHGGREGVSSDRIANMAAVVAQFPQGAVVIDCGTLINLDVIGEHGVYKGGNVLPGPLLLHRTLSEAIPRIPEVPRGKPAALLGRDVVEAVQNGVFYAVAGGLNAIMDGLSQDLGQRLPVLATGGFATELANHVRFDHIEPNLTLIGLKRIFDRNWQPTTAALTADDVSAPPKRKSVRESKRVND